MAKTRSPNYPALTLSAALEAVRPVYDAEHRNRMSREVLAKHLGYNSLNGRSLSKIGAVRAYGLVEGTGDEQRVSDDAVHALEAPTGSPERDKALAHCALRPSLFSEIRKAFPDKHPSEPNLRYWLIKNQYTPDAAGKAAATYLETMRLVSESAQPYNPQAPEEQEAVQPQQNQSPSKIQGAGGSALGMESHGDTASVRRAVFPISEGDVTLIFPADLSPDGYDELGDYLEIFLRRAKRESAKPKGEDAGEA